MQERKILEGCIKLKRYIDNKFASLESAIKNQTKPGITVEGEFEKTQTILQKQETAFEDVIGLLERKNGRESLAEKRILELETRESSLINLFTAFQKQLFYFEHATGTLDENWKKQLAAVRDKLNRSMIECGVQEIGGEGDLVNYQLHEVIQTIDTEDEMLDSRVSVIFRPGLIYCGQIRRKARVLAYQLVEVSVSADENQQDKEDENR